MSGVCDSASNRLEFQNDALIVTLSSLLNKVCESPVELDGTKSSSEKELLLSLGEDFLRSHPNSTPSQFLRWVLETPTATDGSSTFAPRLKDNNVLLPNDVKDFLTSVKGVDNLSKEEMYEMLIQETDKLIEQPKGAEFLSSEELDEIIWQQENLSAELSQLSASTSRGAYQISILSQTEKELESEVVQLQRHLTHTLEPAHVQADRHIYNTKMRMELAIKKLQELAASESARLTEQVVVDEKLEVAQAKFRKNLLRAFGKSFSTSPTGQEGAYLKDLQELASIYAWTLKELAKCSFNISLHQNALEQFSSSLDPITLGDREQLCQESLDGIIKFFDSEVLDVCTQKTVEDSLVVSKLLDQLQELSELSVYCHRMAFIKDQLIDEASRRTALTFCTHAYRELQDYLADGIRELETYLKAMSYQSSERIAWLRSLRETVEAWPTPFDHQLLMVACQNNSIDNLDEMTSEMYRQRTLQETQYWIEQLNTNRANLQTLGSFETKLANSSTNCHHRLTNLVESHSTVPYHYPIAEQDASDAIDALKKSSASLRVELASLLKKFIHE